MRKILLSVLILSLIVFSACGRNLFSRYNDDDQLKDLKYGRVKFMVSESFIRGGFSDYRGEMVEEFQKIALEKTNTEISIVFAEETVYAYNLQLRIDSGLDFDLFLGFEGIQSDRMLSPMFKPSKYWIDKGIAADLTDLITPKYENLYNRFEQYPVLKELATYNGRIYTIPSGIQKSDRPYVLVRNDLWDQYGSGDRLESMDDILTFLLKMNDNKSQDTFYIKTHFSFYDYIEIFAWEQGYYMLPGAYVAKIDDMQMTPVPIEDTDILDKAAEYYETLSKNNLLLEMDSSVEVRTILAGNKTAVYLSKNPEEYHYETAGYHPYDYTFYNLYPMSGYHIQIPNEVSLMLYDESKNKERVLTILNWLGNSNRAYDILSYGIEDTNYIYKDKRFKFNTDTVPALGWMQRFNGYPELEKDFATDQTPYSQTMVNNMKMAYINPFDGLLIKNSPNMNIYLDQIRADASLYGSRTSIISRYTAAASKTGRVEVLSFKMELSQQNKPEIKQHLNELIQQLKISE